MSRGRVRGSGSYGRGQGACVCEVHGGQRRKDCQTSALRHMRQRVAQSPMCWPTPFNLTQTSTHSGALTHAVHAFTRMPPKSLTNTHAHAHTHTHTHTRTHTHARARVCAHTQAPAPCGMASMSFSGTPACPHPPLSLSQRFMSWEDAMCSALPSMRSPKSVHAGSVWAQGEFGLREGTTPAPGPARAGVRSGSARCSMQLAGPAQPPPPSPRQQRHPSQRCCAAASATLGCTAHLAA